jgi:hypothetical protein
VEIAFPSAPPSPDRAAAATAEAYEPAPISLSFQECLFAVSFHFTDFKNQRFPLFSPFNE